MTLLIVVQTIKVQLVSLRNWCTVCPPDLRIDAVNVYVASGPKAPRLCRFSQKDIEDGSSAPVIEYIFPAPKARKGKKKAVMDDEGDEEAEGDNGEGRDESKPLKRKAAVKGKGKGKQAKKKLDQEKDIALGSDEEEGDEDYPDYMGDDDIFPNGSSTDTDGILPSSDPPDAEWAVTKPAPMIRAPRKSAKSEEVVEVSD